MSFKIPKIKSRLLRRILGVFFIVLGIIGLFLPVLQGILFILIGLTLWGNKRIEVAFKKVIQKRKEKKAKPAQKTL
jgi:uncharacterized membrane protein YbaN (DUF454 family)